MKMTAKQIVEKLEMEAIPNEGGWFSRQYTSLTCTDGRPNLTSIYALFTHDQFSAMHRLDADEIFFYHSGSPFHALELYENGGFQEIVIGPDLGKGQQPQHTFRKGSWFGGKPLVESEFEYTLLSCVVSPGFCYEGFELAKLGAMLLKYPRVQALVKKLVRP